MQDLVLSITLSRSEAFGSELASYQYLICEADSNVCDVGNSLT